MGDPGDEWAERAYYQAEAAKELEKMAKAGLGGKPSDAFLSNIVPGNAVQVTPNGTAVQGDSKAPSPGGTVIEDYAGVRMKGARSGTPSRKTDWPSGNRSGE